MSAPMSAKSTQNSYGQFCPVAMAAEIFCTRWTALVLRELMAGSRRFNEIRRGLPRISPTLLSKRLKELEVAGLVAAHKTGKSAIEYELTDAGEDLRGVVQSLGSWGHRWIESKLTLKNLDPTLLMWDMRRNIAADALPARRCTVRFVYPELSKPRQSYWLVAAGGQVELCMVDPGFEVNLSIRASLRSMTAVWMGLSTLKQEVEAGNIEIEGEKALERSMPRWFSLNPLAKEKRLASR
ncbi:MAG TPA: helix-turn-helix domain-containing protein [Pseudolabrys sp.]|nr:helix-turn-helix domain-containing protein [Pseudolabrys sp.]